MKYKGVYTTYTIGERVFGSYVLADSIAQTEELIKERNIGERRTSEIIELESLPDYHDFPDKDFITFLPEIIEQVCFLTHVAFSAEVIPIDEALSSAGIINELAGLLQKGCHEQERDELISKARRRLYMLQQKVPGAFPVCHAEKGYYIVVKVSPGSSRTIHNIVQNSEVHNLGPAEVAICDCDNDPDCTISDTDEPCGYHQTIPKAISGLLSTDKDFVHIHNKDAEKVTRVKIKVRGGKKG
jgi:hypothetical protein